VPQQTFVEIAANYRNEPIVTDLVMSQVEQFSSAATVNDDPSGHSLGTYLTAEKRTK